MVLTCAGLKMPAWVTRVGPSRRCASVPRSKSYTSLARLEPICSSRAQARAASAGIGLKAPACQARAVPVITPEAAAGRVLGRMASHQPWGLSRDDIGGSISRGYNPSPAGAFMTQLSGHERGEYVQGLFT